MDRYGQDIVLQEEMPQIDWPSMGRYVYMALFFCGSALMLINIILYVRFERYIRHM